MHDFPRNSWLQLPLEAARLTFAVQTRLFLRVLNLASGAPALPTHEPQPSRASAEQADPGRRSATSSAASAQVRRTPSKSARKKGAKADRTRAKIATRKA